MKACSAAKQTCLRVKSSATCSFKACLQSADAHFSYKERPNKWTEFCDFVD